MGETPKAGSTFVNHPSALGGRKRFDLYLEHVPTGVTVSFPAFITGFSDAYNVNWNAEEVFGRSDPIATYQNTRRAISVSFVVVAGSPKEGRTNLLQVNKLLSLLYPLYTAGYGGVDCGGGATTINMGPLLRVKFGNLIHDAKTGQALLGYVNGFTMDPELEAGMFLYEGTKDMKTSPGSMGTNGVEYVPKEIRLNFEMTVLHEHALGWTKGTAGEGSGKGNKYYWRQGKRGFPYASNKAPKTEEVSRSKARAEVMKLIDKFTPSSANLKTGDSGTAEEMKAQMQDFKKTGRLPESRRAGLMANIHSKAPAGNKEQWKRIAADILVSRHTGK